MNQPIPTGPDRFAFADDFYQKMKAEDGFDSERHRYYFLAADYHGRQAQTAALVMLTEVIANATGTDHADLDVWREKIGMSWLKACRSREWRREQCKPRHTEDCQYADPVPEPKHVLLDVGTRVLVSDLVYNEETRKPERSNPQAGQISGHAAGSGKYRWRREYDIGIYSTHEEFAFADNRVEVHPDGPECPPVPEPAKREPTGPRMYVRDQRGRQGYVIETAKVADDGEVRLRVRWFRPGARPVWKEAGMLDIIAAEDVERCENGQTRDECDSGENQCEPCRQKDDEEGDAIEESMGLR